ncbi:MAG: lipopolysaccharide/colanic/teichoic acid biosynthesis glycosyltransferase [Alphaproteobacteria bacterium]|jgi:lipopolysaccharide/colanic/teichoic acid biosynthesis glycosyltransferase
MGEAAKFDHNHGYEDGNNAAPVTSSTRVLDLCAGLALVVLCSPSILFIALTTMVLNNGRGFRKVSRMARDGRMVRVLNFHASNRSDSLGAYNEFLVNSRFSRMPEIFNVVTGELSFFNSDFAKPAFFTA